MLRATSVRFLFVAFSAAALSAGLSAQNNVDDKVVELSPFEVTSKSNRGYGTANSFGATRMSISVLETPQTVVSLNEKFIEDTGLVEFEEISLYVAGVAKASTQANGVMTMRGAEVGGLALTDGLEEPLASNGGSSIDMIGISRLEFIKGPAGALYGAHRVGGVVNRITKRPTPLPQTTLKAMADDFDLMRFEADTSNHLLSGKLGYRLAAAFQEGKMKSENKDNRTALYSFVDYTFNNQTKIWVRGEYQKLDRTSPAHTFRAAAYDAAEPTRRSLGLGVLAPSTAIVGPGDGTFKIVNFYLGEAGFEHTLSTAFGNWTLKAVGRYNYNDQNRETYMGNNYDFLDANGVVIGNQNNTIFENPNWVEIRTRASTYDATFANNEGRGIFIDLAGKFELGPTKHQALGYYSLSSIDAWEILMRYDAASQLLINPRPLNLRVGVWQTTNLPPDVSNARIATNAISSAENTNFGFQDNFSFWRDRIVVALGIGHASTRTNTNNRFAPANSVINRIGSAWSPSYGLVYRVLPDVSLFANHSETFTPRSGVDSLGNTLRNGRGESDEVGVKTTLWDGRLTGTLTYFETMEDGFLTNTIVNGFPASVQGGIATNTGWELDLAAQPIDSLTLMAGFSDITGKADTGGLYRNGNQGFNWSLFAKYDFTHPRLKGFSASIGYKKVSDRFGDSGNTFLLPAYETFAASIYYSRGAWRFQLQAENVLDTEYVLSAVNQTNIYFGDPRRLRFSTQYRF